MGCKPGVLRVGGGKPFIPNDPPPVLQASLRTGEAQCLQNDVGSNNVKAEKNHTWRGRFHVVPYDNTKDLM